MVFRSYVFKVAAVNTKAGRGQFDHLFVDVDIMDSNSKTVHSQL